jgi:hypothetical protein
MEESVAEMQVALRVLEAITKRKQPDPHDIEELHRISGPAVYESLDRMACAVIRRATVRFKQARAARG